MVTLLIFICAAVIIGWLILGITLVEKQKKTLKTIGWALLSLLVGALIVVIYFSCAAEICGI